MTPLAFFDIGFGEMLVVGFVALLLFGGRLPEVMRSLGGAYRNFRRGVDDLTRQTSKVLDVRSSLPPYRPTPPQATSTPTLRVGEGPAAVPAPPLAPSSADSSAPAPASTTPVVSHRDLSDDPPPV